MVDKRAKDNQGGKPSIEDTINDIDDKLLLMTILEENLDKDERNDLKVRGWKTIAKNVGISEAAAKIRFGVLKKEHKAWADGRIPPTPVVLSRNQGGGAGGNRGGNSSGTRSGARGSTRGDKQALPASEDKQEDQEAEEKEAENQEVEMPPASKTRPVPVPAVIETPAPTQQQRGTKRGLIESGGEADSDNEVEEPTRKAPKRGKTAGRSKAQVQQAVSRTKAEPAKPTGADKTEATEMPQNSQHGLPAQGNPQSHQLGPSALAAIRFSRGSVWPWFEDEERRREEARLRETATRREWGRSSEDEEQPDEDEAEQDD